MVVVYCNVNYNTPIVIAGFGNSSKDLLINCRITYPCNYDVVNFSGVVSSYYYSSYDLDLLNENSVIISHYVDDVDYVLVGYYVRKVVLKIWYVVELGDVKISSYL